MKSSRRIINSTFCPLRCFDIRRFIPKLWKTIPNCCCKLATLEVLCFRCFILFDLFGFDVLSPNLQKQNGGPARKGHGFFVTQLQLQPVLISETVSCAVCSELIRHLKYLPRRLTGVSSRKCCTFSLRVIGFDQLTTKQRPQCKYPGRDRVCHFSPLIIMFR